MGRTTGPGPGDGAAGGPPTPGPRLVVASHRLPFTVRLEGRGVRLDPTVGGLAAGVEGYLRCAGATEHGPPPAWVGWPGVHGTRASERRVREATVAQRGAWPVFVEKDLHDRFYEGFSNRTLWPLVHYVPSLVHMASEDWDAYVAVNARFRDEVMRVARPGDVVWVHDYQLMLLPGMLRERDPSVQVAFFLHVPFPAHDVFRILPAPWARALLEGMLGADLVGFHTHDYARHFLRCVERRLGLEALGGRLRLHGRAVHVDAFPIGVDFARWAGSAADPEVDAARARMEPALAGRRIVLSLDRLDYTKGLPQRLLAFEGLLEREPSLRGRVTLLVVAVPSRTGVEAYRSLRTRVEETVGRVNGRFGDATWTPVVYQFRGLGEAEVAALYARADVALVTPLRDGMNLVAKEYLAARSDGTGALVLSDTAGAARELGESILVNPYAVEDVREGLRRALALTPPEQVARNVPMRARLARFDVARWGAEQREALRRAREETALLAARRLAPSDRLALRTAWRGARRRLLLLDYDGTLVPYVSDPWAAVPDAALRALLSRLGTDARTQVVVVSGRDAETLERWLGDAPVALVAEHGGRRRAADGVWEPARPPAAEALARAGETMQLFADRLPGAVVERKALGVAWHWRAAEPETGAARAGELTEALRVQLGGTPLRVLPGRKVVEVRDVQADKGTAARAWLAAGPWDLVLAAGDDATDEDLFEALPDARWTLRVGPEASRARYNLDGPQDLRALLEDLADPDGAAAETPT